MKEKLKELNRTDHVHLRDDGVATRSAMGFTSLPGNIAVETEAVFKLKEE